MLSKFDSETAPTDMSAAVILRIRCVISMQRAICSDINLTQPAWKLLIRSPQDLFDLSVLSFPVSTICTSVVAADFLDALKAKGPIQS